MIIKKISLVILKNNVLNIFDSKIIFVPIDNEKMININNWKLKPINLLSIKDEQFEFRLQFENNTSLVCLGNEPYKPKLKQACYNTDYLIHDAFCLEKEKHIYKPNSFSHSTIKDACNAANKMKAKNLILIHTEDKSTFGKRKVTYTKEAKKYYQGNIIVPDDLDIINI